MLSAMFSHEPPSAVEAFTFVYDRLIQDSEGEYAQTVADYLRLPPDRVVELRTQVGV